ncbi:CRISPR-associated protein Cas4/endonuclease Cas1 fusion [Candidatus Venteria ishoeyi]|uniref:CRISPR-associated endonuclease Cas1 n=1 Tax=Candidatus Venteria ishoeyi TaxID=1899563 RepID=A0A1H6F768_9GAMM|nr:CRISPR-associated protein Cas4/endonuclease Cas1 fusion [Candidatus Venteria ishoeyi]
MGGEKAPSFAAQVPPESWLAQVETQKQKTAEKALEKKTGIAIGEREQQQALDLVLCGEKALLSTHEARLYIQQGEAEKNSIPWSHLRSILLFGQHHITTPALKAAFKHHVAIHYASGNGIYQGMSSSAHTQHQHSELWLMQQLCFQNEQTSLAAACSIVAARLRHQAEVLRVRQKQSEFTQAIQQLQNLVNKTRNAQDKTQLNGYEGKGASIYFQSLQTLIPEAFGFTGRNRRPPRDPFNVLLSMGYTSLYNHVQSLCYAAGLSPWTGVYHQPHGEHAVLASDLMEPFRHIIERTALSSIMLKQIKLADFKESAEGCFMNTQTRKTWLALLHKNFDKTFKARGETEARNLYQHIQAQNQQLILWIRGEKPSFQAWRLR